MKLLAQHGYGDGNKTIEGIEKSYIDGVVFRPRDLTPEKFKDRCDELALRFPNAIRLFDPQLYAGILLTQENHNVAKLEEYQEYFGRIILSRYESENNINEKLKQALNYQKTVNLSGIIAPNILIRRSFDSRESVISKGFIRLTKKVWAEHGDTRKVYATLTISRDALIDQNELQEFLNDITSLDNPPDGFYLLIASSSSDTARVEMFQPQVLAAWMLINYTLKINGFEIINGYSDLYSPFLAAVGGDYGCTGWWSNTRNFSLEQFLQRTGGGSLPIQRYLSKKLLNRITYHELHAWRKFITDILNDLPTDNFYSGEDGEPERAKEVLQSWEALKSLIGEFAGKNVNENIIFAEHYIQKARNIYDQLNGLGLRPDIKSNGDHLEPLLGSLQQFRQIAEL